MFSPEKQKFAEESYERIVFGITSQGLKEQINLRFFLHAALSKCGLRFPLFSGDARENKQIEQLFRGLMLSKNAKQAPQSQKFV